MVARSREVPADVPEVAATWDPIGSVHPWPSNPRTHSDQHIADIRREIERDAWGAVIVVQASSRRIIAGHGRLLAAQSMGMERVPVREVEVDDDQAARMALADNQLTHAGAWDDEALAEVLRDLAAKDIDLSGLGWSDDELAALLDSTEGRPEPSDDAPEVQEGPADSVLGQVYELGVHRLVCGDCRDPDVVARLLDGRRVNVAFTSPPYASQRKYDESSGFKPIKPDEYGAWFEAVQANVRANLATDGSWFVNIKAHCEDGQRHLYVMDLAIAHVRAWGWKLVDEFCWIRKGVPGGWDYRFKNEFEPVFHFAPSEPKCNKFSVGEQSDACFTVTNRRAKASTSVFDCNAENGKVVASGVALPGNVVHADGNTESGHNAGFPLALPSWFIRAFSDPGDVIFDPFMGSGTTIMAAQKNGRHGYGCEISPKYCDVIRRRWTRYAREAKIDPGLGALDG